MFCKWMCRACSASGRAARTLLPASFKMYLKMQCSGGIPSTGVQALCRGYLHLCRAGIFLKEIVAHLLTACMCLSAYADKRVCGRAGVGHHRR